MCQSVVSVSDKNKASEVDRAFITIFNTKLKWEDITINFVSGLPKGKKKNDGI
jgi:hypothetical protein